MPATLTERPAPPAVQYPPRKRWTRAECERLDALGIFDQQRVELVEGELIDKKIGKNRPHVNAATLLIAWLIEVFGARLVNFEASIDVAPEDNPTNEPEPAAIVLKQEYLVSGAYKLSSPQPRDLDLVVEISDTSLQFDLTTKASLYARAGIPEYWVLDVISRRLLVHRNPQSGQYESLVSYAENESVVPLTAPNSSFPVSTVFPA